MTDNSISVWHDWSSALPIFDFSNEAALTSTNSDIIGKLITGRIPKTEFRRNFQRCAFRSSQTLGQEWAGVDYKDTVFVDASFSECILGDNSTVSCTFTNCHFERCEFVGSAIHDSTYINCTFVEVDFRHSMFRNSQIVGSNFIKCITSNKLFDGCQLEDNTFEATQLDFRAILDNFGLDKLQITLDLIREDRSYPQDRNFDFKDKFNSESWLSSLSSFDTLKVQYYLDGGTIYGSDIIDRTFNVQEWTSIVRAPVNLMRLLQDFSGFILRLYSDNKLPVIFVVKMAQLAHSLWNSFSTNQAYSQLGNSAAGTYIACLRWIEELDVVIANSLEKDKSVMRLRSFDDASDDTILALANELNSFTPARDISIGPRNSPVDIIINNLNPVTLSFYLSLFLFTKTRLELSHKLKQQKSRQAVKVNSLFDFSVGAAKGELHNALSIQTALPGSLFVRIDVNYSSSLIDKLRKTIKEIL